MSEYFHSSEPFDDDDATMLLLYSCYACGNAGAGSPSRTPFVYTDRATGLPIDVVYDPVTRTTSQRECTSAEKAAAEQSPLCRPCAGLLEKTGKLLIRYTPRN